MTGYVGSYRRADRLRDRYAKIWRPLTRSSQAVEAVADAATASERDRSELQIVTPTVADLDDALSLVTHARETDILYLEHAELDLIEAAQMAGQSWQWIGERLGHKPAAAERSAKARHRALLDRYPSRDQPVFTIDTSEVAR